MTGDQSLTIDLEEVVYGWRTNADGSEISDVGTFGII